MIVWGEQNGNLNLLDNETLADGIYQPGKYAKGFNVNGMFVVFDSMLDGSDPLVSIYQDSGFVTDRIEYVDGKTVPEGHAIFERVEFFGNRLKEINDLLLSFESVLDERPKL